MKALNLKTLFIVPIALLASALTTGTTKAADKPTAELSVGTYSQYIWRGWAYSKDSLVIQPSMTVAYKGFGFNLWGNLDTEQYNASTDETNNFNETDMTLSYGGSADKIGYEAGYIYYALDAENDSQEIYAKINYDTLLSPTLTVYKEITGTQGWYANFGISHSISLPRDIKLELGANAGYYDDEADYNEFHDGLLSAKLSIPLGEFISISPEMYYSFGLSSKSSDRLKADNLVTINKADDNFVYGGVLFTLSL